MDKIVGVEMRTHTFFGVQITFIKLMYMPHPLYRPNILETAIVGMRMATNFAN